MQTFGLFFQFGAYNDIVAEPSRMYGKNDKRGRRDAKLLVAADGYILGKAVKADSYL